jgi:signal peptidase I
MLISLILSITTLLVIFLLVRIFLCIVTVEGASMSATLEPDDLVLILKHFPISFLKKEQIAVLDLSQADSIPAPKPTVVIKRLIGLPGDIVRIHNLQVEEGVPFIDMSILSEDGYYEMQIPPGHCFVRADGKGSDSRHWGPIPLHAMVGVVIKRMSKPAVREREN